MMKTAHDDLLRRAKLALNIWTLLTLACAFFIVVPHIAVLQAPGQQPRSTQNTLLITMGVMGFAMAITSLIIRYHFLSSHRLAKTVKEFTAKGLTEAQKSSRFIRYYITWNIVAWGLNESLASLSIIVAQLAGDPSAGLAFAVAGTILNLLAMPNLVKAAQESGLVMASPSAPFSS